MILDLQLLRHGMTSANEQNLYYGASDVTLSAAGVEDVIRKKELGLYRETPAYYTSGKIRANETLKLIFGNVAHKEIPELSEWNFGKFELRKHDDMQNDPDYISFIEDETGEFVCPQGESRNGFYSRIRHGFCLMFEDMISSGINTSTLVSHGGTLAVFMMSIVKSEEDFYQLLPSYAEGYNAKLEYADGEINVLEISPIKANFS